jgi:tyrosyl-tRNA synthetase
MSDETAAELLFLINNQIESNPFVVKENLTKYFFELYYENDKLFDEVKEEMYNKFHGTVENTTNFIKIQKGKISNILVSLKVCSSTTLVRNKIKENGVRINDNIINNDDFLETGKYKISFGKKQHYFIEIEN